MKNSWPLAEVPMALPRQMNQVRGQDSGASGSSMANCEVADCEAFDDLVLDLGVGGRAPPRRA